jgi:hypothetical protein
MWGVCYNLSLIAQALRTTRSVGKATKPVVAGTIIQEEEQ